MPMASLMPLFSILLSISGVVQNVGFRVHVVRIARDLQLTGWVRNEDDGSVSVFAEGEKEKLDRLKIRIASLHHPMGPDVKETIVMEEKTIEKKEHALFSIME